jgi:hypothetical protein
MRKVFLGVLFLGLVFTVACNANWESMTQSTSSNIKDEATLLTTTASTASDDNLDNKPTDEYKNIIQDYRSNTAYYKEIIERDDMKATILEVAIPFPDSYEAFIEGSTSAGQLFFTLEKVCQGSYDDEGYVPYLYQVGMYDINTDIYTPLQDPDPGRGVKYLANSDRYVMWSEFEGFNYLSPIDPVFHLMSLDTNEEKTFTIGEKYQMLGDPVISGDIVYFTVIKDRTVSSGQVRLFTSIYQFDFSTATVEEIYQDGRFPLVSTNGVGFVLDDNTSNTLVLYDNQNQEMTRIPYSSSNKISPVFGDRHVVSRDIFSVTVDESDIPDGVRPYLTGNNGLSGCGIRQLFPDRNEAIVMCINDEIISQLSISGSILAYSTSAEQKPVYYDLESKSFIEIKNAPARSSYCGYACDSGVVFVAKTSEDKADDQTFTVVQVPLS